MHNATVTMTVKFVCISASGIDLLFNIQRFSVYKMIIHNISNLFLLNYIIIFYRHSYF